MKKQTMRNYAYLFMPPPESPDDDIAGVCLISDYVTQVREYLTIDTLKNYCNHDHYFISIYLVVQR